MGGDEQVKRANGRAPLFQIDTNFTIVSNESESPR